ncbi:unnamed protein product [Spirodela intermedia]|uniref:Uncharacterized protein n=2 Tax=Spirodela intermedia TaxID=51605 RepID=A0A7I8K583_SPIIN|nr:unnamed protein product [Spirodela intermedia]CAA6674347.1 unnamed protein product [Spirodela intermedia]CAA6674348.1 unnamed protein product [Spirodela intermedia]CAA7392324.1 unnamed protein product [Spirodela intermedia]CAA7392325.1 unnamed protein product [Spirodela intermedia]
MGSLDANCIASPRGFSPLDIDDFRQQAHQTVEFICEYYKGIESHPVVPQVEPGYLRRLLPETPSAQPMPFAKVLSEVQATVLPGMTHWTNPNFFAYFPATLSSAALCGDLLASALNPVAFNWLSSPAVTELESLTLDWLAQLIRLPKGFLFSAGGGGVLQATTSEAVLCTLVAARKMVLERAGHDGADKLVVYASDQTHSTFAKACKIAGIAPANIRIIPTAREDLFSLRPDSLRAAMEADAAAGLLPAYVCATVGTTSSTAVDPVAQLAEVAGRFGAWVHVDAAYAGSACVCPEFRHHLDGVDRVDSISMSPHKWLLTGLDCCCLWVRDRARLTTSLSTDPEYLKNRATESGLVVDYKDWQIGTGRRFRALKLFMVMRCYGTANLQSHIRSDVRMARGFEEMVAADTRFEVVVPRRFALVCFRMRPRRAGADGEAEADAANRRLLEEVNNSGGIYATHTVIGGIYVIRFAVGTTLTEERHVKAAWELFRAKADAAWEAAR